MSRKKTLEKRIAVFEELLKDRIKRDAEWCDNVARLLDEWRMEVKELEKELRQHRLKKNSNEWRD